MRATYSPSILRNAPHILAPRFEIVFGQPPAHRLARQAVMLSETDHRAGQQFQASSARDPRAGLRKPSPPVSASSLPLSLRSAPGRGSSLERAVPDCLPQSAAWFGTPSIRRPQPLARNLLIAACQDSSAMKVRMRCLVNSSEIARSAIWRYFMIFISSSTRSFLWAKCATSVDTTDGDVKGSHYSGGA